MVGSMVVKWADLMDGLTVEWRANSMVEEMVFQLVA